MSVSMLQQREETNRSGQKQ